MDLSIHVRCCLQMWEQKLQRLQNITWSNMLLINHGHNGQKGHTCHIKFHLVSWEIVFIKLVKVVCKNRPSKICGWQPLKKLKWYGLPKQTISLHFKFFKDCLPQILLGPFLNTLTQVIICISKSAIKTLATSYWCFHLLGYV